MTVKKAENLRRIASSIIMALLFLSVFVFTFTFTALPAKAQSGTIYINPNGSITPSNANITTSDNVTYNFTGNNYLPIVVNRSNIIINGMGHTLQASNATGFSLSGLSNVTIKNTTIANSSEGILLDSSYGNSISGNNVTAYGYGIALDFSNSTSISGNNISANSGAGIYLFFSSSNSISGNNIANSIDGIYLESSSSNSISGNKITANSYYGIYLGSSSSNSISGNNIANSSEGVGLDSSSNNRFFHNNFVNNTQQVISAGSPNSWDNSYPSGGNYWSDYRTKYPNASEIDSSAIWNASYVIDANNTDRYPLMGPFRTFNVGTWDGVAYSVGTVSNSTITNLSFNPNAKTLTFNVTGPSGTMGFCRVAIPLSLMSGGWIVTVNGAPPLYLNITTYGNYTYIYFTYHHSTELVQIQSISVIPEFQSSMLLPLFMIITLLGAMVIKRKRNAKTTQPMATE